MYEKKKKFYMDIYFFFNCFCRHKKNEHQEKRIRKVDNFMYYVCMYLFIAL